MSRTEVELKKPIYLGMCILDTSKTLMYDWLFLRLHQANIWGKRELTNDGHGQSGTVAEISVGRGRPFECKGGGGVVGNLKVLLEI
jgi:hypothetical protein